MRAIILAAGIGQRLFGDNPDSRPKCLMEFDGKTLLQRHIENLQALGVKDLTMVLGHKMGLIREEAEKYSPEGFFDHIYNARYQNGALVSLWEARDILRSGERVLFMDADVLYHPSLLEQLATFENDTCLLYDRDLEEGDEPVNLCISGDIVAEFGKAIDGDFDIRGEWPGFMTMSADFAGHVADALDYFMDLGEIDLPYEPAFRKAMLAQPEQIGHLDITGVPWIEIDFPEDRIKAEAEILPRLSQPL